MKITGDVIDLELVNLKLANLRGSEGLCYESLKPLEPGESVIVVASGKVTDEQDVALENQFFIVKPMFAQEFFTRFMEREVRGNRHTTKETFAEGKENTGNTQREIAITENES